METQQKRERILITPSELYQESVQLAAKIIAGDWQPDVIIPILRGGATISTIVSEAMSVYDQKPTVLWGVQTKKFDSAGDKLSQIQVYNVHEIMPRLRKNQKILFVDDVFDEGTSLEAVYTEFDKVYQAFNFEKRIAVLHTKPDQFKTELRPDYFVRQFSGNPWIVYPHEISSMSKQEIDVVYGNCLK